MSRKIQTQVEEGGETLCNSAALVVRFFGASFGETLVALRRFEWACVGTTLTKS